MLPNIVRNYYTCNIPADAEDDPDRRFELAILDAQERARIYRIPCNWRLVWDRGDYVRIVREARARQRPA